MACWWYLRHTYAKWTTYRIGGIWFVWAGPMLYEIYDDELDRMSGEPLLTVSGQP